MTKHLFSIALIVSLAAVLCSGQGVSPLGPPTGHVNDYVGVMDESAKQALEQKLRAFKEKTAPSAELAVVVVRTTEGREIFDYSLAVARGWGIGSKEDDNPSALLLVAIDDRKYFTQVSRDLEDDLPDGVVGGLQRQFLVPEFKKGNYTKGITDTMDAYMATIERKGGVGAGPQVEQPTTGGRRSVVGGGTLGTFCCLAVGLIFLVIILSRSRGGGSSGGGWGGGAFGGSAKRNSGFDSALPWIIGSAIGLGLGSSGSSSSDWGGSSGGGWGGFGGGGDFGGGGAGGSW